LRDAPSLPFDPELDAVVESLGGVLAPTVTPDTITPLRQVPAPEVPFAAAGVEREDVTIAGHEGDEIVVSVLRRRARTGSGPGSIASTAAG
jgi:hypothetical protein